LNRSGAQDVEISQSTVRYTWETVQEIVQANGAGLRDKGYMYRLSHPGEAITIWSGIFEVLSLDAPELPWAKLSLRVEPDDVLRQIARDFIIHLRRMLKRPLAVETSVISFSAIDLSFDALGKLWHLTFDHLSQVGWSEILYDWCTCLSEIRSFRIPLSWDLAYAHLTSDDASIVVPELPFDAATNVNLVQLLKSKKAERIMARQQIEEYLQSVRETSIWNQLLLRYDSHPKTWLINQLSKVYELETWRSIFSFLPEQSLEHLEGWAMAQEKWDSEQEMLEQIRTRFLSAHPEASESNVIAWQAERLQRLRNMRIQRGSLLAIRERVREIDLALINVR
jgi:hypothetical protein